MSEEPEPTIELKRFNQVDINTLNHRVTELEKEALPKRVHAIELMVGQMQGEITAVKEIARGVGVKLDSGIETLGNKQANHYQELKNDQIKNHSFVKGILWCGSGLITVVALSPVLGKLLQRIIGS